MAEPTVNRFNSSAFWRVSPSFAFSALEASVLRTTLLDFVIPYYGSSDSRIGADLNKKIECETIIGPTKERQENMLLQSTTVARNRCYIKCAPINKQCYICLGLWKYPTYELGVYQWCGTGNIASATSRRFKLGLKKKPYPPIFPLLQSQGHLRVVQWVQLRRRLHGYNLQNEQLKQHIFNVPKMAWTPITSVKNEDPKRIITVTVMKKTEGPASTI